MGGARQRQRYSACCPLPGPTMLAYRHAFHAGNHADVLKHITLCLLLRYMNQKDKPYRFVDTHAGAGGYSLEGQYAQKKGEYELGIERLWQRDDLPRGGRPTMWAGARFNPEGRLEQYPGSPAFAQHAAAADRPAARLRAAPDRSPDPRRLSGRRQARRGRSMADGFEGLKSQLPPSSPACAGADGSELRRPWRLRQGGARAARGTRALRRGRLHGLVSAGPEARGGATAQAARGLAPRAGCMPG